ncbi:MAG: polysaccharide deacetylase family protein [Austwickia sp.]|nr:polysaccharide deacetylase family protein [Austwickia sp.]
MASADPLTVPRQVIDEQWSALRSAGWRLLGLTQALQAHAADPGAKVLGVTFDDGRDDFALVPDLLVRHDARATLYVPTAHVGGPGGPVHYAGRVMSWEELAELPQDRVEIGSHSHRHMPTDVLTDRELAVEVATSREALQDRLGRPVWSFCYPNGYAAPRQARIVASAGFRNACVVGRRLSGWADDLFLLPRLQVLPEHGGRQIIALVERGERGWVPRIKEFAHPPWRMVRQGVYRTSGRVLT